MNTKYFVKFAETQEEITQTCNLRYNELLLAYNNAPATANDICQSDKYSKLVIVKTEQGEVVGTYRVTGGDMLPQGERFVCEDEFDISELKEQGQSICELSRAVIKTEHRNGIVLTMLIKFIADFVVQKGYRYIIGDVSFNGVDKNKFLPELSYLANYCGADDKYRIVSLDKDQPQLLTPDQFDETETFRKLPPLVRMYSMIGAKFSKTFFSDYPFGSLDAFVLLDMQQLNAFANKFLK